MTLRNRQRGLGVVGWLLLILAFGSVLTVGLKLFPVYADHSTMKKVMESMSGEAGLAAKRNPDIVAIFTQKLKLNNIREFDATKNVQFIRSEKKVVMVLRYEERMPLIYNLDLVASFNEQVNLRE